MPSWPFGTCPWIGSCMRTSAVGMKLAWPFVFRRRSAFHADLHSLIVAQFVMHVAVTIALLPYPMARVEYDGKQEVSAAAHSGQEGVAPPTEVGYSTLQVQAKCHVCQI
ncbi:unnamed protein product [Prorocentrum cordatum]|uniref:Uncharacterized protein n=1 Tax=Prorocentrum cordatum TaxID=2364126 RepID=A0ABN9PLJ9_9DINO|nr:unnamed protein product [Polarella glacialis]